MLASTRVYIFSTKATDPSSCYEVLAQKWQFTNIWWFSNRGLYVCVESWFASPSFFISFSYVSTVHGFVVAFRFPKQCTALHDTKKTATTILTTSVTKNVTSDVQNCRTAWHKLPSRFKSWLQRVLIAVAVGFLPAFRAEWRLSFCGKESFHIVQKHAKSSYLSLSWLAILTMTLPELATDTPCLGRCPLLQNLKLFWGNICCVRRTEVYNASAALDHSSNSVCSTTSLCLLPCVLLQTEAWNSKKRFCRVVFKIFQELKNLCCSPAVDSRFFPF